MKLKLKLNEADYRLEIKSMVEMIMYNFMRTA